MGIDRVAWAYDASDASGGSTCCAESGGASRPANPQTVSVATLPGGGRRELTGSGIPMAGVAGNMGDKMLPSAGSASALRNREQPSFDDDHSTPLGARAATVLGRHPAV